MEVAASFLWDKASKEKKRPGNISCSFVCSVATYLSFESWLFDSSHHTLYWIFTFNEVTGCCSSLLSLIKFYWLLGHSINGENIANKWKSCPEATGKLFAFQKKAIQSLKAMSVPLPSILRPPCCACPASHPDGPALYPNPAIPALPRWKSAGWGETYPDSELRVRGRRVTYSQFDVSKWKKTCSLIQPLSHSDTRKPAAGWSGGLVEHKSSLSCSYL